MLTLIKGISSNTAFYVYRRNEREIEVNCIELRNE